MQKSFILINTTKQYISGKCYTKTGYVSLHVAHWPAAGHRLWILDCSIVCKICFTGNLSGQGQNDLGWKLPWANLNGTVANTSTKMNCKDFLFHFLKNMALMILEGQQIIRQESYRKQHAAVFITAHSMRMMDKTNTQFGVFNTFCTIWSYEMKRGWRKHSNFENPPPLKYWKNVFTLTKGGFLWISGYAGHDIRRFIFRLGKHDRCFQELGVFCVDRRDFLECNQSKRSCSYTTR